MRRFEEGWSGAMRVRVVTLFPEMVESALAYGICGRALKRGMAQVVAVNPRDFATDSHRTVDDRPFGGGPGMVLKFEPVAAAVAAASREVPDGSAVIFLTPQGRRFDQDAARRLSDSGGFVLVAGRYEGFDERLLETVAHEEWSLGDFVMSGGELAALAVIDAVVRLLPGALGDEQSAAQESFSEGLLDCPQYTRPEQVGDLHVPKVLVEGNHALIARWRRRESLGRTYLRRPDLLARREWLPGDRELLAEYLAERGIGDNASSA
jgi:tRNA (guanine37-N1)-methyltransferase